MKEARLYQAVEEGRLEDMFSNIGEPKWEKQPRKTVVKEIDRDDTVPGQRKASPMRIGRWCDEAARRGQDGELSDIVSSGEEGEEEPEVKVKVRQSAVQPDVQKWGLCMEELVRSNVMSRLPPIRLGCFSGTPEEFPGFMDGFDSLYGSEVITYDDRYAYLVQHTQGEPLSIVRSCRGMGSKERGYKEARRLLEARYGVPELVGRAYLNKLMDFPKMDRNNPKELDKFALTLVEVRNALEGGGYGLEFLENSTNLARLVDKLPYGLREAWRRFRGRYMEKGKTVRFEDLVKFVRREAVYSNDPLYSEEALGRTEFVRSAKPNAVKPKVMMIAPGRAVSENQGNQGESSDKAARTQAVAADCCPECGESHPPLECSVFRRRHPREKYTLLRESWRCFNCTKEGHMAGIVV